MFKEGQIKNRERRKVKQGMQTIVAPSWDWIDLTKFGAGAGLQSK